jgi:hypothetical protein
VWVPDSSRERVWSKGKPSIDGAKSSSLRAKGWRTGEKRRNQGREPSTEERGGQTIGRVARLFT